MLNNHHVDSIFHAAVDIPSRRARIDYLHHACGADSTLRARVDELLSPHDEAGEFMQDDGCQITVDQVFSKKPGDQIGSYKLREQIGEGGFGLVLSPSK